MKNENVMMLIASLQSKIPQEKLPILKMKLEEADDHKVQAIQMVQLKDPVVILVVSLLLGGFGVDRFMLGHIGAGIGKLLTCGGFLIWTVIDWFLVMKIAKEENFNKIMMVL